MDRFLLPRVMLMKHGMLFGVLVFALVFAVGAARAAEADRHEAGPDAAAADEPRDAAPGIQLTLIPNQVSINRSVNFDERGEPRHNNHNLSVGFRCEYETDDQPLSYSQLSLAAVVTSAGESLDVDSDRHRHHGNQTIHPHHHHQGKPSFNLYFNLPAPKQPARSLREVRGTVKMQLSDGPERAVRLSPISKYLDKRFKIVDMNDTPMSLRLWQRDENEPVQLELIHPRSAQPLIREVSFFDARGQKLEIRRRGTHGSNDEIRQQFEMPGERSTMVIRLFRQTREVEVPFVARDVPLPMPEPGEPTFDFAIETESVKTANAALPRGDELGPEAPGEDVQIIILD